MINKKYTASIFIGNCQALYPQFIQLKRSLGCKYESEERMLASFDRFLLAWYPELFPNTIPREAIERWETKTVHESPKTHSSRMLIVRKFCEYASERGYDVFVSTEPCHYKSDINFVPHIYSRDELKRFFMVVDRHKYHVVMSANPLFYPTLFRTLYCCGLRLMEALNLKVKDIDLKTQLLHLRNAKFGKDRTVPFGDELSGTINRYLLTSRHIHPDDYFFTSPYGGRYSGKSVEAMFRKFLSEAQIAHCGRNKGPRIHDFRHTFAVTCLKKWFNTGENLQAKLPILSTYLGHADLRGTQRYLRLTSQMFPHITELFEKGFGTVFATERTNNNEQAY